MTKISTKNNHNASKEGTEVGQEEGEMEEGKEGRTKWRKRERE